jgi:hypothetical protein
VLGFHEKIRHGATSASAHKKPLLQCNCCSEVFDLKRALYRHYESAHRKFLCKRCLETFDSKAKRKEHSRCRFYETVLTVNYGRILKLQVEMFKLFRFIAF